MKRDVGVIEGTIGILGNLLVFPFVVFGFIIETVWRGKHEM